MRATASGVISFGLVTIGVKLYLAASGERVKMKRVSPDGNLTNNKVVDAVTGKDLTGVDLKSGYEYAKGQYVFFTKDELASLSSESNPKIDIKEFVPFETVDLIQVEKSYYLGPDKNMSSSYKILAKALEKTGMAAVGLWATRGRDNLVVIRAYEHGMVMHQMYFSNEIRAFSDMCTPVEVDDTTLDYAVQAIEQFAVDAYDPSEYKDGYVERIHAAVEKKQKGETITEAPKPTNQIANAANAFKAMVEAGAKKKPAAKKTSPKKKASAKSSKKTAKKAASK